MSFFIFLAFYFVIVIISAIFDSKVFDAIYIICCFITIIFLIALWRIYIKDSKKSEAEQKQWLKELKENEEKIRLNYEKLNVPYESDYMRWDWFNHKKSRIHISLAYTIAIIVNIVNIYIQLSL